MNPERPAVTRHDVERLWADAIAERCSWLETSRRAEALIDLVNSENPIVNSGLLSLYYLWQPGARRDPKSLSQDRERWRTRLHQYDANPAEWTRRYFEKVLAAHADRQGDEAGRSFGRKLAHFGLLAESDVARVLDDRG